MTNSTLTPHEVRPDLFLTGSAHRVRAGYPFAPGVAAPPPTAYAPSTLTPGLVPGNLRVHTDTDPAKDYFILWDDVPATATLTTAVPAASYALTLLRTEIMGYPAEPTILASVPPGTTRMQMTDLLNDHQPQIAVRAVYGYTDNMGMAQVWESVYSNVTLAVKKLSPLPNYIPSSLSIAPLTPVVTPQWNAGAPQNLLEWSCANASAQYFRVDRDGVTLAEGLFQMRYIDSAIMPGSTHTYTVYGMVPEATPVPYSPPSATVTCTALTSPAPLDAALVVSDVQVYEYDGNAILDMAVPAGYTGDVRVYNALTPDEVKYCGLNPTYNDGVLMVDRPRYAVGIDVRVGGSTFIIELVDKAGPYAPNCMTTKEMAGMTMGGPRLMATNGQGAPVNVPAPIGPPVQVMVTGTPAADHIGTLANAVRGLCLTFHDEPEFSFVPYPNLTPEWKTVTDYLTAEEFNTGQYPEFDKIFTAPNIDLMFFQMNNVSSKAFCMKRHLMFIGDSGGNPGTNAPAHNNNGGIYLQSQKPFTLAPSETLRVFLAADGQVGDRRWPDLFVKAYEDPFFNPGKFRESNLRPTQSGFVLRLEMQNGEMKCNLFYPPDSSLPGNTDSSAFKLVELLDSTTQFFFKNEHQGQFSSTLMNHADWAIDLPFEVEWFVSYTAGGGINVRAVKRQRYSADYTRIGGGPVPSGYAETVTTFSPASQWPWAPDQNLQAALIFEVYHLAIDARLEGMNATQFKRHDINNQPLLAEWHLHTFGYDFPATFPA